MPYRIAVVTPYYKEPLAVLRQCHLSVAQQQTPADHFLIADGFPNAEIANWNARHVVLPVSHGDNGNTPRSVGSLLADSEGYDFIAYLDADNWFHPDHLSSLIELHEQTNSPVCCSWRTFHRLDGSQLPVGEEPGERELRHVDTSCFLIHRSTFRVLSVWHRMPRQLSPACDRIFRITLMRAGFAFAYSRKRTIAFRSQYRFHYRRAGEEPPPGVKAVSVFKEAREYLASREGIGESADRLGFWPMADPDFFKV